MQKRHNILLMATVVLLATFVGVIAGSLTKKTSVATPEGVLWPNPKKIASVTVTDNLGETVLFPQKSDKWKMVFFGYTYCPDICPTTLEDLRRVYKNLSKPEKQELGIYFASVDHARDTPEVINRYLQYFDGVIAGVGGSEKQVKQLAKTFGAVYIKQPLPNTEEPIVFEQKDGKNNLNERATDEDMGYLIDHFAGIFLLSPSNHLVALIPGNVGSNAILEHYQMVKRFIEQQT